MDRRVQTAMWGVDDGAAKSSVALMYIVVLPDRRACFEAP